jgi:hypothetical protein
LKDPSLDRREFVDWINLVKDRKKWQAAVNMALKLRVT